MKEKLIIIGGGGHCHSCLDVIETEGRFEIAGILDLPNRHGEKALDHVIGHGDHDLPRLVRQFKNVLIALGQIKSPDLRIKYFHQVKELGGCLPVIISPRAYVSRHSSIGEGTVIFHDVVINANAQVGKNCIINTKALLEHDVIVGDHCHISTGAIVNGTAFIGEKTFLGSNTVTRDGIKIGRECVVAAGSRVMQNLEDGRLFK